MSSFLLEKRPWSADAPLTPESVEARMRAEKLPFYRWANGPGETYAVHTHDYHKIIYVVSGSIVFTLPQTSDAVDLAAGDRLALPAGTRHGAVVGPDGVVCLEGHQTLNG